MTVFKSEFQPAAIAAAVETAETFGSAAQYLRRLYADVKTELASIDESVKTGIPFVRQFAPARAAECYTAIIAIQDAAKDLGVKGLARSVDWELNVEGTL